MHHTDERIKKLAAKGLTDEQIARKIGRPDDLDRVRKVTLPVVCHECGKMFPLCDMSKREEPFTFLCLKCKE